MNVFHRQNVEFFNCDLCDFQTIHKESLLNHKNRVHLRVEVKKYPCPMCDTTIKEKGDLRKHIEAKHTNKKLTCGICDYKSSSNENIGKHKARVHGSNKLAKKKHELSKSILAFQMDSNN